MTRRGNLQLFTLALSLLMLTGCEAVGLLASGVTSASGGETVKKTYELPDRRTAVMVDARRERGVANVLDNPTMRSIIATDAVYFMSKAKALGPESFVPVKQVNRLEADLGDVYPTTPIDEFGKQLGAQQLIYILIDSSSIDVGGGLFQPKASVQIKVIDVEAGVRLFPEGSKLSEGDTGPPGFPLEIEMPSQTMEGSTATVHETLTRQLAHEVGLRIGRLFFDSRQPDMGMQPTKHY